MSPHDDDSVLFAAATCLRERPTVVVVTDSHVQPARGDVGCSADERAAETARAHEVLGCPVVRLGLRDDDLTYEQIVAALSRLAVADGTLVYTPALEGGHPQHDLVTLAARSVFGDECLRCYSTYARLSRYFGPDLQPVGTTEVALTAEEQQTKTKALRCYESQLRINLPHFQAVQGRSEWLSGPHRLHLGCGAQLKEGWINADRVVPAGVQHPSFRQMDFAAGPLLVEDSSVDYVFSEDVLEHLPPERRVGIVNEIYRVLVPNGIMEHYVPNAGSQNDFGSPSHLSHWNLQCFEHFNVASHRWASDRHFEGIVGGFAQVRAELVNWQTEYDGAKRAQGIHVIYRAIK